MSNTVPFKENACCDVCGRTGAFDFMGDYICTDCYAALPDHDDCGPNCPECNPFYEEINDD